MTSIAVIGCGYWGRNLVRNFAELGVLAAVCDRSHSIAEAFAQTVNSQALTFDEILNEPQIDGVVIAAAPHENTANAIKALATGKHVFVEKPYAISPQDHEAVTSILAKSDRVFMVGHLLLYHPAFLKAKELLESGIIGPLQEIRSTRYGLGRVRPKYGVLWELAPHDMAMILALNPRNINHITGFIEANCSQHGDHMTAHYTFDNEVTAKISCSWLEPNKQHQLVLHGEKGFIVFDDTKPWQEKITVKTYSAPFSAITINNTIIHTQTVPLDVQEPLKLECQHFIDCIQNKSKPRTDIQQAGTVFKALYATEQTLQVSAPHFRKKQIQLQTVS